MCTYSQNVAPTKVPFQDCHAWGYAYAPTFLDMEDEMEDPIPFEDRFDAIDAERIASRDPEYAIRTSRRRLAGSFHEWMRQTSLEEDAARRIQQFMRHKLRAAATASSATSEPVLLVRADTNAITFNSASTLSFLSQEGDDQDDEEHLQYDVYLWHGSYLGLDFYPCNVTGLPCIEDPNGNNSLPGMWKLRQGDYLISINDCSTHTDTMAFEDVMQILEDGVRPAVLRFRHARIHEMRHRSSLSRISSSRSSNSMTKKHQQKHREKLERSLCYVVWREEDGPLGVVFVKPDRTKPYPSVAEVNPTGVVARETKRDPVRAGDLLLSINHLDVSTMGYTKSLAVLKYSPRPLVLTFRHTASENQVGRCIEL